METQSSDSPPRDPAPYLEASPKRFKTSGFFLKPKTLRFRDADAYYALVTLLSRPPSYRWNKVRLMEETGMSHRRATRAMKLLVENGHLRISSWVVKREKSRCVLNGYKWTISATPLEVTPK